MRDHDFYGVAIVRDNGRFTDCDEHGEPRQYAIVREADGVFLRHLPWGQWESDPIVVDAQTLSGRACLSWRALS